ncbi:MAG: peptidylprolyl isomerase [Flavobacterium sp. BFFFF2]|nr:MAG: peptidylprolyl isomerase [Flavobacterium sp. BFFFF2]
MRLRTKPMNIIRNLFLTLIGVISGSVWAQEVVKDSVKPKVPVSMQRLSKVDGIIATLGDYTILESDIDKSYLELSSQGISTKEISRCQMMGKLLEEKLYAHQAIQDSIIVKDDEVKSKLDEQISYMVEQLGDMDKVVKYFKKDTEEEFKSELFEIIKNNKLTAEMQRKIINAVEITPEEVRTFFKKIPSAEIPQFGAELEVAQIVVQPKISDEEKQKVIKKLKEIKKEVQEGASFTTKAVLYSQDPGSRAKGGFYKMTRKTPFVKEFKDVAFSLTEGEISEPFETEFGFHIIFIEKIRGQEIDLRHILLMPRVTDESLKEAKEKITMIRKRIQDKELSFAVAASQFSDEKETKNNGGVLINPKTQDTHFELTKMDPSLYSEVSNLKNNEISRVILDEDQKGTKKFKIITVTNRINEHTADYVRDYTKIKDLALKEKQIEAIAKWSSEKINETYIKIFGEYRDCTFTNNWLKK